MWNLIFFRKKRKRDEDKCEEVFDDGGALKALVKLANAELARKHKNTKVSNGSNNSSSSPLHMKRPPKPNVIQSPKSDPLENGVTNAGTSSLQQQQVEGQTSESLASHVTAEFRRPAVPPARSAQHQVMKAQPSLSVLPNLLYRLLLQLK